MDMGVREWLVVIAVILILGILADGYRRMRVARRQPKDLDFSFGSSSQDFNDELPNGGARVKLRGDEPDQNEGFDAYDESSAGYDENSHGYDESNDPLFMPPPRKSQSGYSEASTAYDDEQASAQSLHDSGVSGPASEIVEEESFGSALDDSPMPEADPEPFYAATEPEVATDTSYTRSEAEPVVDAYQPGAESAAAPAQTSLNLDEPVPVLMEVDGKTPEAPAPRKETRKRSTPAPAKAAEPTAPKESEKRPPAEEIIVINVLARNGGTFAGEPLLQLLLGNGLKYGEMSIFHRHEQFDGQGPVQFSLANGVEPGSFDLDHMDQLQTPLVTLFMGLPGPKEPLKAFEMMATAAQTIARELDGELKDESRSVMTQQTLTHCKQRITEFERRQLTRERDRF
ncbi:cell division protein ZipA [Aestuariirhabdus sp. Z084]|uniref:cell division protein ZipA n=1 Tax=Aestuariirhabdus haliotis TaxID=2918751 RepID=UPI00201B3FE1|nr:cell division protein ZipA [Aestuariirhabdus haliotis]MCL6415550.1 cell division protein ZipA [Aestuariirhabdus haliotis]MCL6419245.1 cell division protein ZipA [Aestuariirhabdus haliotis]